MTRLRRPVDEVFSEHERTSREPILCGTALRLLVALLEHDELTRSGLEIRDGIERQAQGGPAVTVVRQDWCGVRIEAVRALRRPSVAHEPIGLGPVTVTAVAASSTSSQP
jgi:hypothetical protein